MSSMGKYAKDDEVAVSPAQDHSDRFPADTLLRQHGFRIHARPSDGPDLWEKNGVVFPVDEALLRLPEDAKP